MIYGYVRVSTKDQNEARQVVALNEYGVNRIIVEKQSGKVFDRPKYRKLKKASRRYKMRKRVLTGKGMSSF
ncbi:MAG: recombinase family protein [Clostridia bacterium]|nr:recombinase family protein [Clostridia bacterium]